MSPFLFLPLSSRTEVSSPWRTIMIMIVLMIVVMIVIMIVIVIVINSYAY